MKAKDGKEMTLAEAKVIADRFKSQRKDTDQRREWQRSPLDRYEHELLLLAGEGLTNTELVQWVRRQDRRLDITATKMKFWLTRHGIVRKRKPTETEDVPTGDEGGGESEDERVVMQQRPGTRGGRSRGLFSRS